MDELIIGDKKYLSSKQAAKATGYAKDYIGQLCREGRVPARLVGRSWYVLESALHDHRFGEKAMPEAGTKQKEIEKWESPRYESQAIESLPMRRAEEALPAEEERGVKGGDISAHLQESWKAWFERVAEAAPAIPDVIPEEPKEEAKEERIEQQAQEVPIHPMRHLPPEELLPNRRAALARGEDFEQVVEERYGSAAVLPRNSVLRALRVASVLMALVMASLAVAGSGYIDAFLYSNKRASAAAGVILYNK